MIATIFLILGGVGIGMAIMGIGINWKVARSPWLPCGDTPQQAADFLRDHYGVVAKERVSGRYL